MTPLGIDLGTTYTVGAIRGEVLLLSDGDAKSALLPSVVAFPPNGKIFVGRSARERVVMDQQNTIRSAKRIIGETWHSYQTKRYREHYGYHLVMNDDQGVAFDTRAGWITPDEVATLIVATLCSRCHLEPEQCSPVVTIPASFQEPQSVATIKAIQAVGFHQAYLMDEPVASVIAYIEHSNLKYGAVYDFGGGTFEIAILDCSRLPFRVIGFGSDSYLGGDDIDYALASWAIDEALKRFGWDLGSDPETFNRLIMASEAAKIRLSEVESSEIALNEIDPAAPSDLGRLIIDRNLVWDLCATIIRRTFSLCDEALDRAKVKAGQIEAVFLAGGSTLLPGIGNYVADYFGSRPRSDVNPMHVVSIGASLAAARSSIMSSLPKIGSLSRIAAGRGSC
ncbi:MAG: Hsp70 family protein [Deltaproteobacteria bacterium]|nr:Hsp70 family protein [Deltaproteobacteria bacterium]